MPTDGMVTVVSVDPLTALKWAPRDSEISRRSAEMRVRGRGVVRFAG
jgi:hypothetical protein